MRWATVTDIDETVRGVWITSMWTEGELGPLPYVGSPVAGAPVLVARTDDGALAVIA